MDIKQINNISPMKSQSINKATEHIGFKNIFNQKLSEISETNSQAAINPKTDLIERGGKVLDLLDRYVNELNNPSKTLKDIHPLVKTIEKEVSRIESKASDYTGMDKDIEGFVKDLAITANVALLKFQRGDYL